MPTTYAIPNGRTVFDATLYVGTNAAQNVTNQYGFKPDLVWAKDRTTAGTYNGLSDSVRGVNKALFSNTTDAESSAANNYVTAFNSNGFGVYQGSVFNGQVGDNYVGWQWQAGQGTTSSNTNGSITSTVSANATAGFSIVTYTGDRTSPGSSTVGHGLGVAPSLIITKRRDGTSDWVVQTPFVGQDYFLLLNTTAAIQTSASTGAGTLPLPTSTTFGVTYYTGMNVNGQTCVAYCWAPIAGYSAFGSYTGNGSTDGPFIYTGFRPKYILIKLTSGSGYEWYIYDTSRMPYNVSQIPLFTNQTAAESANSAFNIDILSNGFKCRSTYAGNNGSGSTYIYMAFAENPFKYANAR